MSVQSISVKLAKAIPPIRKIARRLFNRMRLHGNPFTADSVYFRENTVQIGPEAGSIFFANSSYMKRGLFRLTGRANAVRIEEDTAIFGDGLQTVYICGEDNEILIGKNCVFRNTTFFIKGNHNRIVIGDSCSFMARNCILNKTAMRFPLETVQRCMEGKGIRFI